MEQVQIEGGKEVSRKLANEIATKEYKKFRKIQYAKLCFRL